MIPGITKTFRLTAHGIFDRRANAYIRTNFIVQLVQGFVLILRYLLSLPATEIAGVKFTAGPTGDVQMIQVFFQTTPAIAFRNITGYTMGCVDAIGSNFFQFERKIGKYVTR